MKGKRLSVSALAGFPRGKQVLFPWGTRLSMIPIKGRVGVYAAASFNAGSFRENFQEMGISHLIEHLMFSAPCPNQLGVEYTQQLEIQGAITNAYTSKEWVQFEFTSLKSEFSKLYPKWLNFLYAVPQVMQSSNGKKKLQQKLQREKKIIAQELRDDARNPESLLDDFFYSKAYTHPLGHPIGGTLKSVSCLTFKKCLDYFQQYFSPHQLSLAVVGDINPAMIIKQTEEELSKINKLGLFKKLRYSNLPNVNYQWRDQRSSVPYQKKCDALVGVMHLLAFPLPAPHTHPREVGLLLDHYLFEGINGRLFQELRIKKGLVYSIQGQMVYFANAAHFEIMFTTAKKNLQVAINSVRESLVNLSKEKLSLTTLQQTKMSLLRNITWEYESLNDLAMQLSTHTLSGKKMLSLSESCRKVSDVTPSQMQSLAAALIKNSPLQITFTGAK